MRTDLRDLLETSTPVLLATALAIGGFALMRMAALWESYLLLFVSFTFMICGVLMMFGNGQRHKVRQPGGVRTLWRSLRTKQAPVENER